MSNPPPSLETHLPHFAYVTPLREPEFGDLLRRFGCGRPGWVLVDGSARLWGWHWVEASDERWATPNAALCSFVSDQAAREQLQAHGFRVDFDADGSQLGAYLVTEPRVGLPPLTAAPTDRPAEPILPDWEALLSLGAAALTVMQLEEGRAERDACLEPTIRRICADFRRPAVYTPTVMRDWLSSDLAAACTALRSAAGFLRAPDTHSEAIDMLDPLGCMRADDGHGHYVKAVRAARQDRSTRWVVASCCDCTHPLLRRVNRQSDTFTEWSFFEDLR